MAALELERMDATFDAAMTYALQAVGKVDLVLKEPQKNAMKALFNGEDVFLWLPTGFGKSICYEALPFLFDFKLGRTSSLESRSTVLVISPLVSLMTDQVTSLRSRGVSAAILSRREGVNKELLATDSMLHIPGKFSLLFSAPEAIIGSEKWRECLLQFPLNERIVALAVDEAHCVSKWYVYYRYYETDHVCLMMFTLLCVQESVF